MSDDKMVQLTVKVPEEDRDAAKERLDHGGLSRVVREELQRVAHGEDMAQRERLKKRLEKLRDERRELKSDRAEIDDKLDRNAIKIERVENKLDQIRDKEGEYEGMLTMIESDMHDKGMRIFPQHAKIQNAAKKADCTPEDVINDLRERNPSLPEDQFGNGITT